MARELYGIDNLNPGPFGIDSRPSLIGAKFAESKGVGEGYHQAVFDAYWLEGRSIEDRAVLLEIASGLGLEQAEFEAALDDSAWEQVMLADVDQAHQYGLHGVPALVFQDKYLVSGAQPYETLVQLTEKVMSEIEAQANTG